jgi:hypothetical protein
MADPKPLWLHMADICLGPSDPNTLATFRVRAAVSLRLLADAVEALPHSISNPGCEWGEGWVAGSKDAQRGIAIWLRTAAAEAEGKG